MEFEEFNFNVDNNKSKQFKTSPNNTQKTEQSFAQNQTPLQNSDRPFNSERSFQSTESSGNTPNKTFFYNFEQLIQNEPDKTNPTGQDSLKFNPPPPPPTNFTPHFSMEQDIEKEIFSKPQSHVSASAGRKIVLSVEGLTKMYGERCAVNNISFAILEGQIFGFLGANGAGKSTTIKMLTGLTSISSGNAYINGHSVKTHFEKAIANVGAMIEIPQFYPYLSGYKNLKFFAKLSQNKVEDSRIMEVANLVGLGQRIKDKVSNYSLGMKQRLGVAQALLHRPKVLILDEPTNGLDANGIREFRILLKTLAFRENICILVSSHILGEMENLCDNIAIIDKGKIIAFKTLEQIKRETMSGGSQYIKCNAPNLAGKLIIENYDCKVKINGDKVMLSTSDKNELSQMIVTLTQNKILVYGAGDVDYSLEDVFLSIINQNNTSTSIS